MATSPNTVSERVRTILACLIRELGPTFQLKDLTLFVSQCRGKLLRFDEVPLPPGVVGTCIALADVDLITTRSGLDTLLRLQSQLHEVAHLLLQDVPRLSFGPDTPNHATFVAAREQYIAATRRGPGFDSAQELDAELLAAMLLEIVTAHTGSSSLFPQTFFSGCR